MHCPHAGMPATASCCHTLVPVAIWSSLQHAYDGSLPLQLIANGTPTELGLIGPTSCSTNTGRYNVAVQICTLGVRIECWWICCGCHLAKHWCHAGRAHHAICLRQQWCQRGPPLMQWQVPCIQCESHGVLARHTQTVLARQIICLPWCWGTTCADIVQYMYET